jgi:hypothetical protein
MKLHISDGGKGGVGKSNTALALINFLSSNNQKVLVIETDTRNPDVIRCIKNSKRKLTGAYADLRNEEGWNDLLELIEANSNKFDHAVMSLPGSDLSIAKYAQLTKEVCEDKSVQINHYFTINRQPDSLNQLAQSIDCEFGSIANKRIVVLNGLFGERQKFDRFDDSGIKEKQNLIEIFMPELFWKTQDAFWTSGLTQSEFADLADSALVKSRMNQWINFVNSEFEKNICGIGEE